ncbi:hypothetical protein PIB30_056480, partial [Stylosanthes scabra]|nr:hypothetical protein [Stylosanthes scabra]
MVRELVGILTENAGSVTKESIRGASSRLAGPKLFKIFEFYSQRADSVHHRTDSFLNITQ